METNKQIVNRKICRLPNFAHTSSTLSPARQITLYSKNSFLAACYMLIDRLVVGKTSSPV
jgi:hypothetical protein